MQRQDAESFVVLEVVAQVRIEIGCILEEFSEKRTSFRYSLRQDTPEFVTIGEDPPDLGGNISEELITKESNRMSVDWLKKASYLNAVTDSEGLYKAETEELKEDPNGIGTLGDSIRTEENHYDDPNNIGAITRKKTCG